MFSKVLIANRGEIAVRVARTVQEMGMRAVAVYSEPDHAAPHVALADEAYPLDGLTSGETYLRGDTILEIAHRCGADAIHPGYGFLSENAAFAQACSEAGITFIGPPPAAIRAMGDKVVAKQMMDDAGVPIVPGWSFDGDVIIDQLQARAEAIGYPLLVKAAAGGGGKGMRVVHDGADLIPSFEAAQREANAAFGDARVFLEKYLPRARHVEFQIFGDAHGNIVHLFERECSIQRRHQKIIEEAPAPNLPDELRAAMGDAAVRAARALGYANAGTVEFMVDEHGHFYFLEVNTRLQVEHSVTEMTLHHDLVQAQILVAAGHRLPFAVADLRQTGHAIECRVYAEDPTQGFLPSTGTILVYEPPNGPNIRVDSGVTAGSNVSVYYDPMLAKVTAWGRTRDESIARMIKALGDFVILGVTTNLEFLRSVVVHEAFQAGLLHTRFLDEHDVVSSDVAPTPDEAYIAAALAMHAPGDTTWHGSSGRSHGDATPAPSPWQTAGTWRAV